MAIMDKAGACVVLAAVLLVASGAHAASHAAKCEAAKLKAAGKYNFCRLLAEQKAVLQGGLPDYSPCNTSLSKKWSAAETHFGMACPTSGDLTLVQGKATAEANATALQLAGTRFVDNGDGTVRDLQTGLMWEKKTYGSCVNLVDGLPVRCASDDDCVDNLGGGQCVCSYDTCPNFVGNTYTWNHSSTSCSDGTLSLDNTSPNGTAFTDFLFRLNVDGNFDPFAFGYGLCISFDGSTPSSGGFAGHCDWRLPTIEELRTIVDPTQGTCGGGSGPCIDPVFGPTAAGGYWSATSGDSLGDNFYELRAFYISGQSVDAYCKTQSFYVRAVRGGL